MVKPPGERPLRINGAWFEKWETTLVYHVNDHSLVITSVWQVSKCRKETQNTILDLLQKS